MRTLRGLGAALVVSSAFAVFIVVMLGATWLFAILASGAIGLAIVAVVLSRTSEADLAADAAWLAAAPDLPPASDRRALEQKTVTLQPDGRATPRVQAGRKAKRGAAR
jgi:hypothetical protein